VAPGFCPVSAKKRTDSSAKADKARKGDCTSAFLLYAIAFPPAALAQASGPLVGASEAAVPSYGWALAKMLIALIAVLAALLLVAKLLPRVFAALPKASGNERIEVLAAHRLEPGRTLYVVKARGREFLVASGEGGCSLIAEVTPQAGVDAGAPDRGAGGEGKAFYAMMRGDASAEPIEGVPAARSPQERRGTPV